jgi:hypothetical protein
MISLMDVSMYTAVVTAVLMLGLTIVYARIYRDTHAQFSLGLTIFALILFAQNVFSVYSILTMSTFLASDPFVPYLLGINVAQVLGIAVLFKTTLR